MMTMSMVLLALLQSSAELRAGDGMNPVSWVFMLTAMTAVSSLTIWCFWRILRSKDHFDPDGTGPAAPPVPSDLEIRDRKR